MYRLCSLKNNKLGIKCRQYEGCSVHVLLMQWWDIGLQEGRDKQFLVKQIEALSQQVQIPEDE